MSIAHHPGFYVDVFVEPWGQFFRRCVGRNLGSVLKNWVEAQL
jgi:hypothetical protein